ncbi:MAG: hypothetical protein IRZ31_19125 [Thermogemmatispora sp.]|uniref:hypothetical protein n=1 Tax=Thermogemmatispora sp. TaxID=1968838 RepID=UPI002628E98B|nr:hypothetical protein [Thermogemmatispora sp.]MBX5459011.1 hypothetical protein [Thermogemmatispora sp.]
MPPQDEPLLVDARTYEEAYGESLEETLDIERWQGGSDLEALYRKLEAEIAEAVVFEQAQREPIRREVFPRIARRPGAPRGAGCYRVSFDDLRYAHRALLFNGAVEACDGTSQRYDSLPITITQLGVCLVSYQGDQGSWSQRLFRRDLRATTGRPLEDLLALLERRSQRGSIEVEEQSRLSELARRGIMSYAERAVLTWKAQAPWRLGHGPPVPYELLTGSGSMELFTRSLAMLEELLLGHRKVVFVQSDTQRRHWLTIGQALEPLEFLVLETIEEQLLEIATRGHYPAQFKQQAERFSHEVGSQVVMGVYRASAYAPPYIFYSHIDHVFEAALIALADSVLHKHRGFPLLIDLADAICRVVFGNDIFEDAIHTAYVHAGEPFRFVSERRTRSRK